MRDPLRTPGAANIGATAMGRGAPMGSRWELGVVVAYNSATHTSVVRTHSGRPLRDVPQLKPTSGSYDHLETGTSVIISWDLGIPIIIGCIDFVGPDQAAIQPTSVTGVEGYGDADPTQAVDGNNTYKPPAAPTDLGASDWAQTGPLGNHVAVLGGGMTSVGAPTAMMRSFGISGVLQMIARRFQTTSDFGQWRIENDQGRTSFILRAGASQATQTGLDEKHWTIRIDLGATGDIFDFSISEPMGKLLFRLHVGADGRVQMYGDAGVDISSGSQGAAETRHDIDGRRVAAITRDDVTTIRGSRSAQVDGNCDTQISGNAQRVVGGADTAVVGGDGSRSIGGDGTSIVTGAFQSKIGKSADVSVGDDANLTFDAGLTTSVARDMSLKAQGVATLDGAQVKLTGNAFHPLPLFDVFLIDFSLFLVNLTTMLAALAPIATPLDPAFPVQLAAMQAFATMVAQGILFESTTVFNG